MNKKILAVTLIALLLSGCSWLNKKAKENPPSDKNMICSQIRQQMLFDPTSPNMEYSSGNAYTRQNQLLSQYKKFGCEKLENKQ